MITKLERLHEVISNVCPILGVSIPVVGDSTTVRIDFECTATVEQKAAAQIMLSTFDWSDAADISYEDMLDSNQITLKNYKDTAVLNNTSFIANMSPTMDQKLAQIKELSKQNNLIFEYLTSK